MFMPMREPNRILAVKKRGTWYAAVTDGKVHGGGTGTTYEEAIGQALANFHTETVTPQIAKIFRLPSAARC